MTTPDDRHKASARAGSTILDAGLSRREAERIAMGLRASDLFEPEFWTEFLKDLDGKGSAISPVAGATIMATDYAPLRFVVDGLIVEGLTLLSGRPKIGKSWALLGLAVAVATPGSFLGRTVEARAGVLYLALEDTPRRIKKRLATLGLTASPAGLDFVFSLPRIDEGGADALDDWLGKHPDVKLVILDVLNKVRSARPRTADQYLHDAAELGRLHAVAQARSVSLVVSTHDRKAAAEDWLERISGTLGVTGAADTVALLERERGSANGRLRLVGRDLEDEPDLSLEFRNGLWHVLGPGEDLDITPDRRRIVGTLKASRSPLGPAAIAKATGQTVDVVRHLLRRLAADGRVTRSRRGLYLVPPIHDVHDSSTDVNGMNEGNDEDE
jgi:hypothetical protein